MKKIIFSLVMIGYLNPLVAFITDADAPVKEVMTPEKQIPLDINPVFLNQSKYIVKVHGISPVFDASLTEFTLKPGEQRGIPFKTRTAFFVDFIPAEQKTVQVSAPWWQFWAPKTQPSTTDVLNRYIVRIRGVADEGKANTQFIFSNPPQWFRMARGYPIIGDNLLLSIVDQSEELALAQAAKKATEEAKKQQAKVAPAAKKNIQAKQQNNK